MKLLYILFVFFLAIEAASAQENFMVNSISFEGNKPFSGSVLRGIMLTKQSPAAVWRFLYSLGHLVGDSAQYLDPLVLKADLQRIKQFYFDNGFIYAQVDSSLKYNMKDQSVDIKVDIKKGPPAFVAVVRYHGIPDTTKSFRSLLLNRQMIKKGDRYAANKVDAEVQVF